MKTKLFFLLLLVSTSVLTILSCEKTNEDSNQENPNPSANTGRIYSHRFYDEFSAYKRFFFYQPDGLIDSVKFYLKYNKKQTAFFYYNNNNTIDYYKGPEFGLWDYSDTGIKKKYFYNSDSLVTEINFQNKSGTKDNVWEGIELKYNNNEQISVYLQHWNFQDIYCNYVWDGDNISEGEFIVNYFPLCSNSDSTLKYLDIKSYYTYDLNHKNNLRSTYINLMFTPKYLNKNLITQEMRLLHHYEFNRDSCTATLLYIDTVNINFSYEIVNGKVEVIRGNGNVTDSIKYYY